MLCASALALILVVAVSYYGGKESEVDMVGAGDD